MKALLDTRTFLWAISGDPKLSSKAQEIFAGPSDLWLSVASLWEILIKVQIGRLPMPSPAGPYILGELVSNNIEVLPIKLDHVLRLESLPVYHRDPFDRRLRRALRKVGQSLLLTLTLQVILSRSSGNHAGASSTVPRSLPEE